MTLDVMVNLYTVSAAVKFMKGDNKMNSILGEISTLRKGAPLVIDYKNSNRYRLVAIEPNGTKTAYYFSSPIYNSRTRKSVDIIYYL